MMKYSIQYQINHKLHIEFKLILMRVDSTNGCKVKEGKNYQMTGLSRFTMRKSSSLVYFGTLPCESATVSMLHAAGTLSPGSRIQWQAGSWKLEMTSWKLEAAS